MVFRITIKLTIQQRFHANIQHTLCTLVVAIDYLPLHYPRLKGNSLYPPLPLSPYLPPPSTSLSPLSPSSSLLPSPSSPQPWP